MRVTRYKLTTEKPISPFRAAIVADLHDHPWEHLIPILEQERPDLILIPGDLTETLSEAVTSTERRPGLGLLSACVSIAPTFYSFGNHEIGGCHGNIYKAKLKGEGNLPPFTLSDYWRDAISKTGAILLNESWTTWNGVALGGLGSGLLNPGWIPRLDWLGDYTATPGYKLLLCHHPEYFNRYLRPFDIDMIVSGHAHGGQWRFFGRGVYAPDQHLFPKYTSGVHENRLVISRGVVNTVPFAPRFFNPCEVVTVSVENTGREE